MKRSKEIKTALIVLLGLIAFIWGFDFLKGSTFFKKEKTVYTVYDEVEGLVNGAKVTINGLQIGKITAIDFLPNTTKILVTMSIRENLTFTNQSTALLYEAGLIGGKAISIIPDFSTPVPIATGDTLVSQSKPGLTEIVNQQIAPLQDKITSTLTSVDSLFIGVNNVLNTQTQNNLKETLENLTETVDHANKATQSLARLLTTNEKSLNNAFRNIETTSANLSQITDSLRQVDIKEVILEYEKIAQQLNSVLYAIDTGEGTAGKLIKNDSLYQNLNYTLEELGQLINDLKQNPKRYVHFSLFGRKNQTYKAPADKK